jgi:hypothetical protein
MKPQPVAWIVWSLVLFLNTGSGRAATCGGPTGASYYVSPSGSDTNPCSAANPCREIRQALTLVHPGDIVHVADGLYLGFTAQSIVGSTVSPIMIRAQGTNAYVRQRRTAPITATIS